MTSFKHRLRRKRAKHSQRRKKAKQRTQARGRRR
jgi:hypothetical protein